MGLKRLYEIICLIWGFSNVAVVTFFLVFSFDSCVIFFESYWFIRIPEIIIGISVLPYYLKKIFGGKK